MDVIFDIDGTLADASHRLRFIKDPVYWIRKDGTLGPLKPDWDLFLSDEQVAKDSPIPQTWAILDGLLREGHTIIFITGRNEGTRQMTWDWLTDQDCEIRERPARVLKRMSSPRLYMRRIGDHRPSSDVKRELLNQAQAEGFNPKLVFEDRADDTEMWRSEGLLCCQVAKGNY